MEEVKKVKKQKLAKKKAKKIEVKEVKEVKVEEVQDVKEVEEDKVEQPIEEKLVKEEKSEEKAEKPEGKEEKKKEEKEKKEKKSKKGLIIFLVALLVLVGGALAAKMILTKTTVTTETVKISDDARGFSNYFKEYILDRVRAEKLFSYSFRNMTNEEILAELSDLKDGFSKISRGVTGTYNKSEYKDIAEVMSEDSSVYLSAVRELRAIMTETYNDEGDRQLAFMRKIEETTKGLRSALYIARAAFTEDVQGFSSKGALIFEGPLMVEVGGGVMNILLGNSETQVTATTTDDIGQVVKAIEAQGLYGYVGSRVVKIGDGLGVMLEEGWVRDIKVEVKPSEAVLTTTRISTVMKNVWGMNEELEMQGIKGLVETEKGAIEERLNEVVKGLKGTR